jgi:hypothetical protein
MPSISKELGIGPEKCISSSTLICYRQSRESGYSFFSMLANRLVHAIVSWKISLLAAEEVSIL